MINAAIHFVRLFAWGFVGFMLSAAFLVTVSHAQTAIYSVNGFSGSDPTSVCQRAAVASLGTQYDYCTPDISGSYCFARFSTTTTPNCGNGGGIGGISVSYSCPAGQSYVGGTCKAASTQQCSTTSGQAFSGFVAHGSSCPSFVTGASGCRVRVDTCLGPMTGADGLAYTAVIGAYDGQVGTAGAPVGQPSSGSGALIGATPRVAGAGAGVDGGGTTGFTTYDATNLSSIATNTATTVSAIDRAASSASMDADNIIDALSTTGIALQSLADRFTASIGVDFYDCNSSSSCGGDAIECATLLMARKSACSLSKTAGVSTEAQALNSLAELETTTPGQWAAGITRTIDVTNILDRPRWLTEVGCPTIPDIVVMGIHFPVSLAPLCTYKDLIAALVIMTACFAAYRIVFA